jgi:hypothetical protein
MITTGNSYLVASALSKGHVPDNGEPPQTGTYDIMSSQDILCNLTQTVKQLNVSFMLRVNAVGL